jgi:hypothetical protein
LQDDNRFGFLTLYSLPEQTTDYFEAMEAGKMLMGIMAKNQNVKAKVIDELKETAKKGSLSFSDQKKGMSLYLLGRVLGKPEEEAFKKELMPALALKIVNEESYADFYLDRL